MDLKSVKTLFSILVGDLVLRIFLILTLAISGYSDQVLEGC